MSTLWILVNVFNEADTLDRAVESVRQSFASRVDEVHPVFVDGRYPDFPGEDVFSTDGTKEAALRLGTYLPVHDYECEKRTAGLRYIDTLAQDGDWVLYLDADETITSVTGWPDRVGRFEFTRRTAVPAVYDRCRLYRWEPGLEFRHRHYDLYTAAGELIAELATAPDYQVVGFGDHFEKPRTPEKQAYFHILRDREGHPSEKVPA